MRRGGQEAAPSDFPVGGLSAERSGPVAVPPWAHDAVARAVASGAVVGGEHESVGLHATSAATDPVVRLEGMPSGLRYMGSA